MILKLGMKHHGEELYIVYINHDAGMTFTYFNAMITTYLHLSKCHLKGKISRKWANGLKIYESVKGLEPKDWSAPNPKQYTCVLP